jgi:hypothetical protein
MNNHYWKVLKIVNQKELVVENYLDLEWFDEKEI